VKHQTAKLISTQGPWI